jgi:ACS family hexuronate transporter-like MFS transporter
MTGIASSPRRSTPDAVGSTAPADPPLSRYRWTVCALLFFATTINYIDRQVLGILAPTLQSEIGWNEAEYGAIVSWFTAAYAIGYVSAGRIMDRIGVRLGFAIAIVIWSLAGMSHALASSVFGFAAARFMLGIGESANFPGALKAVSEWFPARERAFATGIFNAGSNVGAILTPLIVPVIALRWGWRAAFIATGALGFLWLAFWLPLYKQPASQHAQTEERRAPWSVLLTRRQTWAFVLGKFLTDPIWWFYLFWLPKFLDARFGVKLATVAAPIITIYLLADVGSVGGGWLSGALIKRGWSVNAGRKTAMLIAAVLIVPTAFAASAPTLWTAVALVGLAAAAHQWWSANLFTLSTDMFPRAAVGTVVGMGGFAGAAGGFLFQRVTGLVLQSNGNNYVPIFAACGSAYVIAFLVIHMLAPRLEPATIPE